jgi:hypothetical protein
MTLSMRKDTGHLNRKHWLALSGELALKKAISLTACAMMMMMMMMIMTIFDYFQPQIVKQRWARV